MQAATASKVAAFASILTMVRLLLVACLVLLCFATAAAVAPAPAPGDCSQDVQDLMSNCQDYMKFPADPKIPPSPGCCAVIQRANIPCLCSKVTPQVEQFVCMDKVAYVVAYCKRPFPPGSHCGSYHVPGLSA